jgi:hypothetical protein
MNNEPKRHDPEVATRLVAELAKALAAAGLEEVDR